MTTPRFVRFALEKDNVVHTVPGRHQMTEAEKSAVWLTYRDYKVMKYNVRRIVSDMDDRKVVPTECTRGLECKTKQGAMDKKVASLDGICAVLLEQERQRLDGCSDAERIRAAYVAQSKPHADAAAQQGSRDAAYENGESSLPSEEKTLISTKRKGGIHRLLFKRRDSPPALQHLGRSPDF